MILRFAHVICNTIFPSRMEVITEDGEAKIIKLIEGSTIVDESKQPKDAKLKEFKTGFANILVGDEAFYQTEITDKAILNYLKATPYWGKYIFEYDPIKESKSKSAQFVSQAELIMNIAKMKHEDLLALGYALKGNTALEYAKSKDYEGLRLAVAAEAQENPDNVSELTDDPKNADKLMTGLAFAKGILIETEAGNSVSWGHNTSKIISVPKDVSPLDAVVDFYGEADGREVKKLVFQKLGTKAAQNTVAKAEAESKAKAKAGDDAAAEK